jgi:hypothetical protein
MKKREYTPENITELKDNEIFVFGSNKTGFHGAGAAGFACRGDARNNWRQDEWFIAAINAQIGSEKRIGKWAVYGVGRGFQEGKEGKSYGIDTIKIPGHKRSTPLSDIKKQIEELNNFANNNPQYKFLVTKIGSALAGYTVEEIRQLFIEVDNIADNIILPIEYEFRDC